MLKFLKKFCTSTSASKKCSVDVLTNGNIPMVYNNILELIGNTPMVRLNSIPKNEGVDCEILAKCRQFTHYHSFSVVGSVVLTI